MKLTSEVMQHRRKRPALRANNYTNARPLESPDVPAEVEEGSPKFSSAAAFRRSRAEISEPAICATFASEGSVVEWLNGWLTDEPSLSRLVDDQSFCRKT